MTETVTMHRKTYIVKTVKLENYISDDVFEKWLNIVIVSNNAEMSL